MSRHVGTESHPEDTFVPQFDPDGKSFKIRDTKHACLIAEDESEEHTQNEWVAAFQYLIDNGQAWTLGRSYSMAANALIENEECFLPEGDENDLVLE